MATQTGCFAESAIQGITLYAEAMVSSHRSCVGKGEEREWSVDLRKGSLMEGGLNLDPDTDQSAATPQVRSWGNKYPNLSPFFPLFSFLGYPLTEATRNDRASQSVDMGHAGQLPGADSREGKMQSGSGGMVRGMVRGLPAHDLGGVV